MAPEIWASRHSWTLAQLTPKVLPHVRRVLTDIRNPQPGPRLFARLPNIAGWVSPRSPGQLLLPAMPQASDPGCCFCPLSPSHPRPRRLSLVCDRLILFSCIGSGLANIHPWVQHEKELDAFLLLSRSFIERSPGSTYDSSKIADKMATHTRKDDFCLECHWESFHLDGKSSEDSSVAPAPDCCPDKEQHASEAHGDSACCDTDNCSITCPSVCDGFVDCNDEDDHDRCSVSRCEESHCHDPAPICFDEHCFDPDAHPEIPDHSLESLFGLGIPMASDKNDFSLTLDQCQADHHMPKPTEHAATDLNHLCAGPFFSPDSIAITPCHPPHSYHHDPHSAGLSHVPPAQSMMPPSLPMQNEVNPSDVFHMLGMCPDYSNHFHVHEASNCPESLDGSSSSNSFTCLHLDDDSLNSILKNPIYTSNTLPARGPCRSNHRCRSHHAHSHHFSPYARHSRSSISSQILPSPGETPPPLDGGVSSVITSPDYSAADGELHVCKWVINSRGIKTGCGAAFSSASALQEHLVSRHMGPVNGAKGTGYYCCWEGCSRPGEPFSQKSKLQGHFLTHSNCKSLLSIPV